MYYFNLSCFYYYVFLLNFFLGLLLFAYWPLFKFYMFFLRGEFEFLVNILFKFIMYFCLGSSSAALLGLNNLFLIFLFAGFVCSMPYLFMNKVVVFSPFYFIIFFVEDPRPNYIMFFLCFTALSHNFILLFGFFLFLILYFCMN